MRRLKSDVLSELPEKVVQDYMCQLTDVQRKLYELVVDRCSLKRDNKIEIGEDLLDIKIFCRLGSETISIAYIDSVKKIGGSSGLDRRCFEHNR